MIQKILITTALMLTACHADAEQPIGSAGLAGFYLNDEEYDTYLGLREDGKAVSITKYPDGSWQLLMVFSWSASDGTFCQRDIVWTATKTEFFKEPDTCTKFRVEGTNFLTLSKTTDTWVRWQPTVHDVFEELADAAIKQQSGNSQ